MARIPEVDNLFPISEMSAYIAFGPFDQQFAPSKREGFLKRAASLIEDGDPHLYRFLLYRQHARLKDAPLEALGNVLGNDDPELGLDEDEHTGLVLQKFGSLDKLNRFRSGYVRAFFTGEPALKDAVDKYMTDTNPLASVIRLPDFARGIRDVVSIFKAHHEIQSLKATFGNS